MNDNYLFSLPDIVVKFLNYQSNVKNKSELTLDEYKEFSDVFDSDLYSEISLENCVAKRVSRGGTGYDSVNEQIVYVEEFLK